MELGFRVLDLEFRDYVFGLASHLAAGQLPGDLHEALQGEADRHIILEV